MVWGLANFGVMDKYDEMANSSPVPILPVNLRNTLALWLLSSEYLVCFRSCWDSSGLQFCKAGRRG